jgi:anti-anti-sigma factor
MEFTLKQIKKGEVQILALNGYMGNDEFGQVDNALALLLEQKHGRVILDLKGLSFVTARSLAQFLVCGQEFRRQGGELKLVGLSPDLSRLAEMAGFNGQKDFEPDLATALKNLCQRSQLKPRQPPKKKK